MEPWGQKQGKQNTDAPSYLISLVPVNTPKSSPCHPYAHGKWQCWGLAVCSGSRVPLSP